MSIIAPSILASDWGRFKEEISAVADAGADWIHIDVMDGHFVPPITFGPDVVAAAKSATNITLDVHLMIEKPENQIEAFAKAGADIITVHVEACNDLPSIIRQIHSHGVKAGVSVKPNTSLDTIESVVGDLDLLLIMTVEPGWGGQKFIESSGEKIAHAATLIANSGRSIHLQVDGGINVETAKVAASAGAEVLVAGTFIFGSDDYAGQISLLR